MQLVLVLRSDDGSPLDVESTIPAAFVHALKQTTGAIVAVYPDGTVAEEIPERRLTLRTNDWSPVLHAKIEPDGTITVEAEDGFIGPMVISGLDTGEHLISVRAPEAESAAAS